MNWKFVIRITGAMTAISLFFVSLLFFAFSEFQYDQPHLINDLGEFGPVMTMQEEIHLKIDGPLSRQFKVLGGTFALIGALVFAATLLGRDKLEVEKPSTP